MKKLTNGLTAKFMDEFMGDIWEEIEDEDVASELYHAWLAYGVPDGNDYQDCVIEFGDQEDFDELKETFVNLLNEYDIPYDLFIEYVQKNFWADFLEMIQKSLDK